MDLSYQSTTFMNYFLLIEWFHWSYIILVQLTDSDQQNLPTTKILQRYFFFFLCWHFFFKNGWNRSPLDWLTTKISAITVQILERKIKPLCFAPGCCRRSSRTLRISTRSVARRLCRWPRWRRPSTRRSPSIRVSSATGRPVWCAARTCTRCWCRRSHRSTGRPLRWPCAAAAHLLGSTRWRLAPTSEPPSKGADSLFCTSTRTIQKKSSFRRRLIGSYDQYNPFDGTGSCAKKEDFSFLFLLVRNNLSVQGLKVFSLVLWKLFCFRKL